jgi:4-amino-4-deoxy-L-arabinose transferase-like glycosyltransferase
MRANVSARAEPSVGTPTDGGQYLKVLAYQISRVTHVIDACLLGLITFLVHGYRLSAAPDIFSDEGIYLLLGTNVAKGFGLVVDHRAFFNHPPAYFLVEATYIKLAGLTNADPLTAIFSVRYLNVFFSAATASLLLLFGRKLHSYKVGFITATLFLMDPYVQRINRRNMLETLAMLFLLLGVSMFFTHRQRLRTWQWLGSGIAFGLAMLTKEVMALYLLAFLGMAAWARRTQLSEAVRVAAIACLLYLAYPLWEIASGEVPRYLSFKLLELSWLVPSFTGHGRYGPTQKTHSLENLWILLGQYAMSYLLIALAGIFTVILFIRFRHLSSARYLFSWSLFSFGYDVILGRASDQYLYFLMVPVVLVNGYCLAELFWSAQRLDIVLLLFLLFSLFMYNCRMWITRYGHDSDNGYTKIIGYVKSHVPPGAIIDVSDDAGHFFLSPSYTMSLDRDKQVIIERREHYFIMSSKDQWGGYNATTPEFYHWVVHNSQPLLVERDHTFWQIGLYYLMVPSATSTTIAPARHSVTEAGGR